MIASSEAAAFCFSVIFQAGIILLSVRLPELCLFYWFGFIIWVRLVTLCPSAIKNNQFMILMKRVQFFVHL